MYANDVVDALKDSDSLSWLLCAGDIFLQSLMDLQRPLGPVLANNCSKEYLVNK